MSGKFFSWTSSHIVDPFRSPQDSACLVTKNTDVIFVPRAYFQYAVRYVTGGTVTGKVRENFSFINVPNQIALHFGANLLPIVYTMSKAFCPPIMPVNWLEYSCILANTTNFSASSDSHLMAVAACNLLGCSTVIAENLGECHVCDKQYCICQDKFRGKEHHMVGLCNYYKCGKLCCVGVCHKVPFHFSTVGLIVGLNFEVMTRMLTVDFRRAVQYGAIIARRLPVKCA